MIQCFGAGKHMLIFRLSSNLPMVDIWPEQEKSMIAGDMQRHGKQQGLYEEEKAKKAGKIKPGRLPSGLLSDGMIPGIG